MVFMRNDLEICLFVYNIYKYNKDNLLKISINLI